MTSLTKTERAMWMIPILAGLIIGVLFTPLQQWTHWRPSTLALALLLLMTGASIMGRRRVRWWLVALLFAGSALALRAVA